MAKRTRRQVIRILNPEAFAKAKKAILKFDRRMVEQGFKKPEKMTDTKVNAILLKTCLALWGEGEDLYLCSAKSNCEQAESIVNQMVDSNTQTMLATLSDWLGISISYRREGNHFYFDFKRPDGSEKTLEIERGRVVPSESQGVRVH